MIGYTTLQACRLWSDILSSQNDALIADLIARVSRVADKMCNQVFGQRDAVGERCVGAVDRYGRLRVWVPAPAVASVTALSFRPPAQPGSVTVDPGDLEIEDRISGAVLVSTSCRYGGYRGAATLPCKVSGSLGWDAADIPGDFELMVRKLVLWAYKRRETAAEKTAMPELGVVIIPGAVPPDIKAGLGPYVLRTGA